MDDKISVNGIEYVKATPPAKGTRAVVVVDRGWIYAGDVSEANGRIRLERAVWVFSWKSMGFAAMVSNPKQSGVDLRKMPTPVDIPSGAEIFRCPVGDDWGL